MARTASRQAGAGPAGVDRILAAIAAGDVHPIYLVSGDRVIAEPQAGRIAEALAERAGCAVERHRRPAELMPILTDLETHALLTPAKVALLVDTAVVADAQAAADLVDQAAEGLPFEDPSAQLRPAQRRAASRLMQALRVFGLDPSHGAPAVLLEQLPKTAFQGGRRLRKGKPRGRPAKAQKELREGLANLLAAAREAGLVGFAEDVLAELGSILERGLPTGHALVLAEGAVDAKHPLVERLAAAGAAVDVGQVEAGRRGGWTGLDALVAELQRETGAGIARDALDELAQRTLRQRGGWGDRRAEVDSTGRFAAEYRKLAALAGAGRRIERRQVESAIADRGEEDVWAILGALGEGRGGEALGRFRRMMAGTDDVMRARLSFFSLLATFCRHLTAISGMIEVTGVSRGERNYRRFESTLAPRLQGELPGGGTSPLKGLKPFRVYKAYQAASRLSPAFAAQLPWLVLQTEMRIKGESRDADAAISQLLARLGAAIGHA